jgi:aryl-alcohol dehydrogenase-like predicted oxidoreductase
VRSRSLQDSLAALEMKKVDIEYLHAPDRSVPFAETLEAINKEFVAGKFARFGLVGLRATSGIKLPTGPDNVASSVQLHGR